MSSSALLSSFSKGTARAGVLVLAILLAVSYSLRRDDFGKATGVQNLEATYHALLVMKALKASPVENHWFLPTVTLGNARDKHISWGATVPTRTGDYVYTSFAPPGFLAPYVVFRALGIEGSEANLAHFNCALGALVSVVLYALLVKVLGHCGYGRPVAVTGAVLGTAVSIFSREVLQSHGLVYWSHGLYQLILISGLYLLFAHLTGGADEDRSTRRRAAALVVVVFLGAWTEWTGYVFGVGLAILFWYGILLDRPQRRLSVALLMAVAAAGLLTLVHYGFAVGFEPALKAFVGRFADRNAAAGSVRHLLEGYALSFGLFVVVAFAAAALSFFLGNGNSSESPVAQSRVAFLFLAATVPLLENFALLQHATEFSFDRLKFLFPVALMIALAFARQSTPWRFALAVSLVFASIQGYSSYRSGLSQYGAWPEVDSRNRSLARLVMGSTDVGCSVLFSNIGVRAYSNLLFNRGIYGQVPRSASGELIDRTRACSAIYLEGETLFTDLQRYRRAVVTRADGGGFSFAALDLGAVGSDFFLSDPNWENGVARHWSGFFVPNTDGSKAQLTPGAEVVFGNGDTRKIVGVKASGQYLNVDVDGPALSAAQVGLPTSYFIRSTFAPGR